MRHAVKNRIPPSIHFVIFKSECRQRLDANHANTLFGRNYFGAKRREETNSCGHESARRGFVPGSNSTTLILPSRREPTRCSFHGETVHYFSLNRYNEVKHCDATKDIRKEPFGYLSSFLTT